MSISIKVSRFPNPKSSLNAIPGLTFQAQGEESVRKLVQLFSDISSIDTTAEKGNLQGSQWVAIKKLISTVELAILVAQPRFVEPLGVIVVD